MNGWRSNSETCIVSCSEMVRGPLTSQRVIGGLIISLTITGGAGTLITIHQDVNSDFFHPIMSRLKQVTLFPLPPRSKCRG